MVAVAVALVLLVDMVNRVVVDCLVLRMRMVAARVDTVSTLASGETCGGQYDNPEY